MITDNSINSLVGKLSEKILGLESRYNDFSIKCDSKTTTNSVFSKDARYNYKEAYKFKEKNFNQYNCKPAKNQIIKEILTKSQKYEEECNKSKPIVFKKNRFAGKQNSQLIDLSLLETEENSRIINTESDFFYDKTKEKYYTHAPNSPSENYTSMRSMHEL